MNKKSWAFRACALLVLGAIINVAVAWGISLWSPISQKQVNAILTFLIIRDVGDALPRGDVEKVLLTYAPNDIPTTFETVGVRESHWTCEDTLVGFQDTTIDAALWNMTSNRVMPTKALIVHIRESRVGWPMRALVGAMVIRWPPAPGIIVEQPVQALSVPKAIAPRGMPRQLPFGVLWPGFAVNTVFYAAVLWGLFAAPFALLRLRRIKHGLCPACAYPVGDSAVCTECGQPVKSVAATRVDQ